ncbi:hypothetical protein [Legionella rowbothamii]|jgi:hypothetical protein|nr:hypothetical protein [Legionella rowbothamii]
MSKDNKFKNESQDARRHDQQHASHDKMKKHAEKPKSDKRK